ncbi:Phospholipase A2 [Nesidiocoris tenuis]|uniref:phospholipase A2 n=1 Tax=Nesidiocoris tenuis TaxID=355587 RepID=A0ABN7AZV6_9HEMI|nr:Phospholipase A2 [Nesidiocoris tenuis]
MSLNLPINVIYLALWLILLAGCAESLKRYTGYRVYNTSKLQVLHHEQTVAVVETGPKRVMYTCELIEVKTDDEKKTTLDDISQYIRKKPMKLKFDQMMQLMQLCDQLPDRKVVGAKYNSATAAPPGKEIMQQRTFSNFGIFPGTKWCGTGDIATNYYDLGSEVVVDKCCRAHDICPVKVLGYAKKYELYNDSFITMSHCECDKQFSQCLKNAKNNIANSMGAVYFNLLGNNCMFNRNNKYFIGQKPRY